MPDLKTELQKLANLKFDDDDQSASTEQPTTNRRERVWNILKANPASSTSELAILCSETAQFISGCVNSFVDRGLATRTHDAYAFRYTVVGDKYPPHDRAEFARKLGLAKRGTKHQPRAPKAQKKIVLIKRPEPPTAVEFDADAILAKLNVMQAKTLLRKLNELFAS